MRWLYERTEDNASRFVLGTEGENPLICIGINPSTAEPCNLDRTLTRVRKVASRNGFDSFVMLNVYPKRNTVPDDLPDDFDVALKSANERWIASVVAGRPLPVYAAWGGILGKRTYLSELARDIVDLPALNKAQWYTRGRLTTGGHPRHPLYVSVEEPLSPFDIGTYRQVLDKVVGIRSESSS